MATTSLETGLCGRPDVILRLPAADGVAPTGLSCAVWRALYPSKPVSIGGLCV